MLFLEIQCQFPKGCAHWTGVSHNVFSAGKILQWEGQLQSLNGVSGETSDRFPQIYIFLQSRACIGLGVLQSYQLFAGLLHLLGSLKCQSFAYCTGWPMWLRTAFCCQESRKFRRLHWSVGKLQYQPTSRLDISQSCQ